MCYVISIVLDKELHRDKADRFLDEHGLYIPNITSNVKGAEKNKFYYQIQIGGCSCGILDTKKDELKILFNDYIESDTINLMVNEYDDNLHTDIQILIDKAEEKRTLKVNEFLKLTKHDISFNVLYQLLKE